jgi:hypothetical protein
VYLQDKLEYLDDFGEAIESERISDEETKTLQMKETAKRSTEIRTGKFHLISVRG